ncbi:uncharacterized protein EV420DRAFT_1485654 [Desarmillaria tabescens]|uniref:Uncharacterized protein n=1 Tax=Armillaria tabescens TaxID=1929756 RepID=A0AA39JJC0_ARMTA|nr:uncharacterized protein EV420DRAFT_1485654 [Desarmillaria tabescens]KAK0441493.1 hypothetical protein EV420DRAFT_1485654 [Desarmillaria tabescens]
MPLLPGMACIHIVPLSLYNATSSAVSGGYLFEGRTSINTKRQSSFQDSRRPRNPSLRHTEAVFYSEFISFWMLELCLYGLADYSIVLFDTIGKKCHLATSWNDAVVKTCDHSRLLADFPYLNRIKPSSIASALDTVARVSRKLSYQFNHATVNEWGELYEHPLGCVWKQNTMSSSDASPHALGRWPIEEEYLYRHILFLCAIDAGELGFVFRAAREVTRIFKKEGCTFAILGSTACYLYGNDRLNDLDILMSSHTCKPECLKELLVTKNPDRFYLTDAKTSGATWRVLWYHDHNVDGKLEKTKVDILKRGVLQLPMIFSEAIVDKQGLPVVPMSILLLHKLKGWRDNMESTQLRLRSKHNADVGDIG